MKFKSAITLFFTALVLIGCGTQMIGQRGNPDAYARSQAMTTSTVVEATVVQVRKVKVASGSGFTSLAAGIGGLTGVALARNSNGNKSLVAGMVGALTGGLIGSAAGTTTANEIIVYLPDNTRRAIVQDEGNASYAAGDTVLVVLNGNEARIVEKQ
jgi:outer membrane lipoprotein SlyB